MIAKTYKKNETRQFVWLDILKANIYIGLGEFAMATMHARQALLASQDINSVTNIAIITDIYGRLQRTRERLQSFLNVSLFTFPMSIGMLCRFKLEATFQIRSYEREYNRVGISLTPFPSQGGVAYDKHNE